jgi:hypothetical protein
MNTATDKDKENPPNLYDAELLAMIAERVRLAAERLAASAEAMRQDDLAPVDGGRRRWDAKHGKIRVSVEAVCEFAALVETRVGEARIDRLTER